ncbi:hypothetical protein [Methanobrevibacter sp.]|uniref:hypothetical protein n=1 Tax=Methanobrevibacter sp. TaxID=66852 RepID=UPI0038903371
MGEITDFVKLYIEDSDILPKKTYEIARSLQNNIKKEAPYDKGRLKRGIRVDTRILDKYSIITGYWDEGIAPHGIFVLAPTKPVEGKLMKMPWGYRTKRKGTPANDFLGRGLQRTLEAYI